MPGGRLRALVIGNRWFKSSLSCFQAALGLRTDPGCPLPLNIKLCSCLAKSTLVERTCLPPGNDCVPVRMGLTDPESKLPIRVCLGGTWIWTMPGFVSLISSISLMTVSAIRTGESMTWTMRKLSLRTRLTGLKSSLVSSKTSSSRSTLSVMVDEDDSSFYCNNNLKY